MRGDEYISQMMRDYPRSPLTNYLLTLSESSRKTTFAGLLAVSRLQPRGVVSPFEYPWEEVLYTDVLQIRQALQEKFADTTSNTYLALLRGVIKSCWRLNLIDNGEYTRRVDFPFIEGTFLPAGRDIPQKELELYQKACTEGSGTERLRRRDEFILRMLLGSGMRRSEFTGLVWEDIHPVGRGAVKMRIRGKGNRERWAYLSSRDSHILEDWVEVRGTGPGPVLASLLSLPFKKAVHTQVVYDALKERSWDAGIQEYIRPHDLRRSFITRHLEAGLDVFEVARLAGHSSIETTKRYDRRSEDSLIESMNRASF